MHEYSLVRALFGEVEKLASTSGKGIVTEVRVQIGPLSGVEPLLLCSAFADLVPHSAIPAAELIVAEVPLTADCLDCGQECEVAEFRFRCPHCKATRLRVTGGDAMVLENITMEPCLAAPEDSL